jgi:uncharacterized Rossmann fold enzyme
VEYERWAPFYEAIRAEFDFPFAREERAAEALVGLLAPAHLLDPLGRVGRRLAGRDAIIVGGAPDAGPPPVWRLPAVDPPPALVAADAATDACLAARLVPDVIVTDLDGPVPAEIAANHRGSLVVVHAHGDNLEALRRWVPQFPGELAGSWAGPPRPGLLNVGGFTDGDRAAFLSEAVGARRLLLWGFDFERVEGEPPERRAIKRRKLAWAERLLGELARATDVPVLLWRRDGSTVPFPPAQGSVEKSTR